MTKHQTVVVPEGLAGREFLRRLLMGPPEESKARWDAAHLESPGNDIEITEVDDAEFPEESEAG